ncbi:HNH endonuclease [Halorarum salinum]|uniref:HNH endonuclease n=1 Tax=Halorarum salinum TaxID=2743089 RepID=A0A7D5QK86_9EURY|nr:HNH endonuclease [Halobaculum salinum]QLG61985.1 HNH endonuclease [Halobaculum salinum]
MDGEDGWAEDAEFFDDAAKQIAREYEVPLPTADRWYRNLGDVDALKQTLGRNAPDPYLDLIRRREWIPYEQDERQEELLLPLKKWIVRRAEGVYLVQRSEHEDFTVDEASYGTQSTGIGSGWRVVALKSEPLEEREPSAHGEPTEPTGITWTAEMQAVQDELEAKEERVTHELKQKDPEWLALANELQEVEAALVDIYQTYLQDSPNSFPYKKDKIIALKQAFPYLRENNDLVAKATDSSISYARQFKEIPGEGIATDRLKNSTREAVMDRDTQTCVCCGEEDELQVHHIIPRSQGGKNSEENLAVLCAECHYYAHGGGQPREDGGYAIAYWDSVEYADQEAFWNEWVHQSFDDRPPKGFTATDFDAEG